MAGPLYLLPEWVSRRKWDYGQVTDDQVQAYDYKLAEIEKHNQHLYALACQDKADLIKRTISLYGERSNAVKYLQRQRIPKPPEIAELHRKWKRRVYTARKQLAELERYEAKMGPKRAKWREYGRKRYARQKQERRDITDAFALEGATERDIFSLILTEQHDHSV